MEISIDELRKRKLFVATPQYGGVCHGLYAQSLLNTQREFFKYGMDFNYFALFNESLITRARNYCAHAFLMSGATHLLFIDSDIEFQPGHVMELLALASPDSDMDVVCGPYPKKNISWEKVVEAVNQGYGDKNPNMLEQFIGDLVFNPIKAGSHDLSEPLEVAEAGTGFMMIQRHVFERFTAAHPEMLYIPDHARSKDFDGSQEITAFFNDPIDPVSRRFLSEDYYFCQEVRKLGMKVWLCPWQTLNHMGNYKFIGNLGAIAAIGANATVDVNKVVKQ